MHGEICEAKHALAREGHRSQNPALPHLRRVKSLWLDAKEPVEDPPNQRRRSEHLRRLNDMPALINQALQFAGADKSEYS